MLQNRNQTGIGIMDLIINRDHDRNYRILHLLKFQTSVLLVNFSNVEISVPQVLSLWSRIQLHGTNRMKHIFFFIGQTLSLRRSLGILFIKGISQLPAKPEQQRLVLV